MLKIQHNEDYRALRRKAYPSFGEQFDAVYKMATALRDQGVQLPEETLDWLLTIEQIKKTYKK